MADTFILLPDAERDIAEGYDWHEKRESGLGEELLRCVDACFLSIRRNPEIYVFAHESYRRALVRRFPYAIFYEYFEDIITVYSVFHYSQDQKKWRSRLP